MPPDVINLPWDNCELITSIATLKMLETVSLIFPFSSWVWISGGHQESHQKNNIKTRLADEATQADGRMMAAEKSPGLHQLIKMQQKLGDREMNLQKSL